MKIKTVPFYNSNIDIYKFGNRVYYYPSFNGNMEFTTYKACCSWIRRYVNFDNWFPKWCTNNYQN